VETRSLILSDKTTAVLARNIPPLASVATVREYRMMRARAEFCKTRTTNAMDLRKAPEAEAEEEAEDDGASL